MSYWSEDSPKHVIEHGIRVVEQALKIPFVAAVILALNHKRPDLAQEVLARVTTTLNEHFRTGAWREVKLLLRFLACLQGILKAEGVFPVLEELFSRSADLQAASIDDVSEYTN